MTRIAPATAQDVAEALHETAQKAQPIAVIGNDSKKLMAGPVPATEISISTAGLHRILQYEPNDLTISIEAGIPFAQVQQVLAERKQMIALDPPFSGRATIGGVVASNSSGPMRRAFGTARDLVIGMTFATLEGKLIKSGGMVVKNVAGLDMSKLMIGSFGTLAVITSLNFRLHPLPPETRTFLFTLNDLDATIDHRDSILRSTLQPLSVDLISPVAAARLGYRTFLLAVRAGGSSAVLQRYSSALTGSIELAGDEDANLWQQIREFTPEFLSRQPGGVVVRVCTTLADTHALWKQISGPAISRALAGVSYLYFSSWQSVAPLWAAAAQRGWTLAVEFAPNEIRETNELWLAGSSKANTNGFAMMKKVKQMFDPHNLLNCWRLYGRI